MAKKYAEKLHPRDRRGQWIKKLKALDVGDGLQGEPHAIGVRRTEDGFQIINGARMMGYPTSVQARVQRDEAPDTIALFDAVMEKATEDELLDAVADYLMLPEAPEGMEGTLLDPAVFQKLVDSFNGTFKDWQAGITDVRYPRENVIEVEGVLARKDKGTVGGWKEQVTRQADGSFTVYHDEIVAPSGGGGGGAFIRYLDEQYPKHGAKKATLLAAMTVGGYIWAREGYTFRRYKADPGEEMNQGAQDRGQARNLLMSRWEEFSDLTCDPDYPHPHVTVDQVREFVSHFAGVGEMPEDNLTEWYPGEDVYDDVYESEVVEGWGGPFFSTPQEIALWGLDEAWDEEIDGKKVKMWLGKLFLLGSRWEGEKDLTSADKVEEAVVPVMLTYPLLAIVAQVRADMPDADDFMFWREVQRRLRDMDGEPPLEEALSPWGWTEALHPRDRWGRFKHVGGREVITSELEHGDKLVDPEGEVWEVPVGGLEPRWTYKANPTAPVILAHVRTGHRKTVRIRPPVHQVHAIQEGWREWLHPRGRGGQWIDAPDVPEMSHGRDTARQARWLIDGLDGFTAGDVSAHAMRTEVRGDYARLTLRLEMDGERVGLAQFRVLPPERGHRYGVIDNIYVREDARASGIAVGLVTAFYDALREHDVDMVKLETADVGGYYWAANGYEWTGDKGAAQRSILEGAKQDGRWAEILADDPERAAELERKLLAGEFTSEAELAAWGRAHRWQGSGRQLWWAGKRLMVGAHWKGERPVTG